MVRHTIIIVFCLIMLPYCFTYVRQAIASGATSSALHIPMYCIQSSPWWASCCCCSGRVRPGWRASAWR
ncbi:MAG: hypothetical protein LUG58_07390 [Clostridiales bacterium]|nr:hypothetical protein [Clostridiales bacterium]